MTKNSNSNKNAKATLSQFKNEVASELGITLKDGYNGDLTSKEAGSIGGEMVRRMIKRQEESMK
ncbi:MAG: alpha/beta-type small acid-soluble spore protein [Lachnospiraceae bacterium]|nr:alpha/beta-type small acid-soluble spore protein [Lachnospiraceae bacterium]